MQTNIIKRLKELGVFILNPQDLQRIFSLPKNKVYYLLRQMTRQGLLYKLQKGKYLLIEFDTISRYSAYTLASNLYEPAYVSFISALSFWQLTDQLTKTVFTVTTVSKPRLILQNSAFQFVKLAKPRFFGYSRHQTPEDEFFVADPEKAILDCLFLPKYSGGFAVIWEAIKNLKKIDTQKLVEYAVKMDSKILLKRLGFLLEKLDIDIYQQIKNKIGESFTVLNPARPRRGDYDKKWKLIVNYNL